MSEGEHEKSALKSVAIFLAFGLGYTLVLHSVAAVYELSIMDVTISFYADYALEHNRVKYNPCCRFRTAHYKLTAVIMYRIMTGNFHNDLIMALFRSYCPRARFYTINSTIDCILFVYIQP